MRLSGWKSHLPSFAGRMVLTQLVLSAIPAYVIQGTILPRKSLEAIDRVSRNFVWGSSVEKMKLHTVSWAKIIRPKKEGSLGLTATKPKNLALLAKLNWRMHKESDSPSVKVLRIKYSNLRRICSRTWSIMKKGKEVFVHDTKWVVGANSSLNFWHDKWLNEGSLRSLTVRPLNKGEDQLEMGEVTQEGGWNFSCCSFVFPCGLLQRIKAILIPYSDVSLDNIS